jgi:hypothetical protein
MYIMQGGLFDVEILSPGLNANHISGVMGIPSSDDDISCVFDGNKFAPGDKVPTTERCLNCHCGKTGGAPICRLQVCQQLPVPPPRGCVLVHRRNECCQRLVCGEYRNSRFLPIKEISKGRHVMSKWVYTFYHFGNKGKL